MSDVVKMLESATHQQTKKKKRTRFIVARHLAVLSRDIARKGREYQSSRKGYSGPQQLPARDWAPFIAGCVDSADRWGVSPGLNWATQATGHEATGFSHKRSADDDQKSEESHDLVLICTKFVVDPCLTTEDIVMQIM